jgi:hypothetical protein
MKEWNVVHAMKSQLLMFPTSTNGKNNNGNEEMVLPYLQSESYFNETFKQYMIISG